jgi:hypothetical protein
MGILLGACYERGARLTRIDWGLKMPAPGTTPTSTDTSTTDSSDDTITPTSTDTITTDSSDDTTTPTSTDTITAGSSDDTTPPTTDTITADNSDVTTIPTSTDTGYFKDQIEVHDTRKLDTFQLSTCDDAVAVIDAFRASCETSPWKCLDRSQVADRLEEIIRDPRSIRQGSLNLCGPAAFFVVLTSRHPVAVANAATTLFDKGAADLGGLHLAPTSDLVTANYASMVPKMTDGVTTQAEWMLLGALRNTTNVFWQPNWRGDPSQELAGMTRPEELASWFNSTGFFTRVKDGGRWATNPGIPNAESLPTYQGYDNCILVNTNLLAAAQKAAQPSDPGERPTLTPAGIDSEDGSFLLNIFPNHWVVLLNEVSGGLYADNKGGYYVTLSIWSWGRPYLDLWVSTKDFVDNYYGAVTTFVQTP